MSSAPAAVRVTRPRAWLLAIRLPTLPAAVGPVLVGFGIALGHGAWRPLVAAATLVVALLLQIAANLANDLFDHRSGADAADRVGPPRAAALGLLSERELIVGIGVVLALASVIGLYLVVVGGPPFLLLGLLAMLSAIAYTGGPWPYGYHALGEPFVFIFFGLVAVAGTAYLQIGRLEAVAVTAAVSMGSLATAILVVNNLRDIATDRRAGKRTLAVLLGERRTVAEYALLVGVAYLVPVALVVGGWTLPVTLLPLATAPLAVPLLRQVHGGGEPARLNPVLRATARLTLIFALLFSIGLAFGVRR